MKGRLVHNPATDRERTAEELRLHYETWEWGGRLPSAALRRVQGSNVLGLVRFDGDLVRTLDAVGPGVQRVVALLAARLACEEAGLAAKLWVARALTELAEGRPLPAPFDDAARMRETLRSDFPVPKRSALGARPPERLPYCPPDTGRHTVSVVLPMPTPPAPGEISQPHFALPAVIAAADPDPLKAALDAVWHAIATYGEHYPELLREIWSACPEPHGRAVRLSVRRGRTKRWPFSGTGPAGTHGDAVAPASRLSNASRQFDRRPAAVARGRAVAPLRRSACGRRSQPAHGACGCADEASDHRRLARQEPDAAGAGGPGPDPASEDISRVASGRHALPGVDSDGAGRTTVRTGRARSAHA